MLFRSKVELLAATGARVDVFCAPQDCSAKMRAALDDLPGGTRFHRAMEPRDFEGAALALAEVETDAEAEKFRALASAAGVPVNVIDKPAFSDFQFGAIVERSPLLIAISTDGGAPVFGQAIRARIEGLLPQGFREWARAAKSWRPKIAARKLDHHARRKFWEAFSRMAFREAGRKPSDDDFEKLTREVHAKSQETGSVALVGAGPGDPELLTLKAARALQSADVVLYDDLVAPGVIDLARREAQKINVGKRGYKPSCTQEDICALAIEHAHAGKKVVRLKGGDPMIFGRAGEEIEALRAAGVAVEVIPGVTSASAAASSLQASLTGRGVARRVQFITAHSRHGKLPDDFDWRALADPAATTAVYMGLKTLAPLAERLIAEGLPPEIGRAHV